MHFLLSDLEDTGGPEDELDQIGSEPPFLKPQSRVKPIEYELIKEEDSNQRASEERRLYLHYFEQVQPNICYSLRIGADIHLINEVKDIIVVIEIVESCTLISCHLLEAILLMLSPEFLLLA